MHRRSFRHASSIQCVWEWAPSRYFNHAKAPSSSPCRQICRNHTFLHKKEASPFPSSLETLTSCDCIWEAWSRLAEFKELSWVSRRPKNGAIFPVILSLPRDPTYQENTIFLASFCSQNPIFLGFSLQRFDLMSLPLPQQQFPPPAAVYPTPYRSQGGSVGPVIAALGLIAVLGVIACIVGRLCSGRTVMGYGHYDLSGWIERKCASCIDGRLEAPPPPQRPSTNGPGSAPPLDPPQQVKQPEVAESWSVTSNGALCRKLSLFLVYLLLWCFAMSW